MQRQLPISCTITLMVLCGVATPATASDDPQTLVGKDWNSIRPVRCQGETLLQATEPLRSYVILTWEARTLFVYREGGPIFEVTITDDDSKVKAERKKDNLKILGVIDLEDFDWKAEVFSGSLFDEVQCQYREPANPHSQASLVIAIVELKSVSREDFPAKRAWTWNEQKGRFDRIPDRSRATCAFNAQGDYTLEDWRENWPHWGRTNFQCEKKDQ